MTAVFSGNSLGLIDSSLTRLNLNTGNAQLGTAGDRNYVNTYNGNLVIQREDALLVGKGYDAQFLRTYNAQGLFNDDNGDNWRVKPAFLVWGSGMYNTEGHVITRHGVDGHQQRFVYSETNGYYESSDGDGAHDRLTINAGGLGAVLTEGTSQRVETYNSRNQLAEQTDSDGNTTRFTYSYAGLLTSIITADNESISLTYDGSQLASITTRYYSDATLTTQIAQSRVYYSYDNNRLAQVSVDLTPDDNSISDGQVFTTNYTYVSDTSHLVASITHSNLATTSFEYDSQQRVTAVIDGKGNRMTLSYDDAVNATTVTSASGEITVYSHDDSGNLTQVQQGPVDGQLLITSYTYDASNNLTRITDPLGQKTIYAYDANGNVTFEANHNGDLVSRLYSSDNLLLKQTAYTATGEQQNNFVYDAERHLRFSLNGENEVTEYRYNSTGQMTSTRRYTSAVFTGSTTAAVTIAAMEDWADAQDASRVQLTDYSYDFRGELATTRRYSEVDANGLGAGDVTIESFVYDARGNLLSKVNALGGATTDTTDGITTYSYDGYDRLLAATAPDGAETTYTYSDSSGFIFQKDPNGLAHIQAFDKAGHLYQHSVIGKSRPDLGDTSSLDGRVSYTYDADGRQVAMTDATGARNYTFYDAAGRVQASVDATGAVTEFVYDLAGQLQTSIAYSNRVSTAMWYDSSSNQVVITDFAAVRPTLSATTDRSTQYQYNARGQITDIIDGEGGQTQMTYDRVGNLVMKREVDTTTSDTTGETDRVTRYFYDQANRQVAILAPDNTLTENVYDEAGQLRQVTEYAGVGDTSAQVINDSSSLADVRALINTHPADNRHTYFFYDGKGQKVGEVNAEAYLTEWAYDAAGNITEQTQYSDKIDTTKLFTVTQQASLYNTSFTADTGWSSNDTTPRLMADINGDGFDDIVGFSDVGTEVAFANGQGFDDAELVLDAFGSGSDAGSWLTQNQTPRLSGDINGDGQDDIIGFGEAGVFVSLSEGEDLSEPALWLANFGVNAGSWTNNNTYPRHIADVNGDGLDDVVGFGASNVYVALSTGGSLLGHTAWTSEFAHTGSLWTSQNETPRMLSDINGDGLADIVGFSAEGVYVAYSNGQGFEPSELQVAGFASSIDGWVNFDTYPRYAEDINGDGFGDIIGFGGSKVYVKYGSAEGLVDTYAITDQFTYGVAGWASFDSVPRMLADTNGDGKQDLVGFARDGLYVASLTWNTLDVITPTSSDSDQITSFEYDIEGQLIKQTDHHGDSITYVYDSAGRMTNEIRGDNSNSSDKALETHYLYDEHDRVIGEVTGQPATWISNAPSEDELIYFINTYGMVHQYDQGGRLVKSTEGGVRNTWYYYDNEDRVSHIINAKGEVTVNRYNAFGELVQKHRYANAIDTSTLVGGLAAGATELTFQLSANDDQDQVTTIDYDRRGKQVQVSRRLEYQALIATETLNDRYEYNSFGELVAETHDINADGDAARETRYTYNAAGQLITTSVTAQDAVTQARLYQYNAFGELTADFGLRNNTETRYDKLGRVIETVDGNGHSQQMSYDAFDRILSRTDASGNVTRYNYNDADRAVTVTTPEGFTTSTYQSQHGEVLKMVDANGVVTEYSYNELGLLRQVSIDGAVQTVNYYDYFGRLTRVQDANYNVVEYSYDALSRVVTRTIDPWGSKLTTSYEFDALGQKVSETDALGRKTVWAFDAIGNTVSVVQDSEGLALKTTYERDGDGNILSETIGAGTEAAQTTEYVYDGNGQLISQTQGPVGLGITTQYVYDSERNRIATIDALGNETYAIYDQNNQQRFVIDAENGVSETRFDASGNVVATIRYANALDITPTSSTTETAMTAAVAAIADSARDQVMLYTYDQDNRQVHSLELIGNDQAAVTEQRYDAKGQLVEQIRWYRSISVADFTASGSYPGADAVSSSIVESFGQDQRTAMVYDNLGRVRYTLQAVTNGGQPFALVTEQTYDNAGRRTANTVYGQPIVYDDPQTLSIDAMQSYLDYYGALAGEQRSEYFVYDNADRQRFIIHADRSVSETRYDAAGNITETRRYATTLADTVYLSESAIESALAATTTEVRSTRFAFDGANRLTATTDALGNTETSVYDAASNRTAFIDKLGRQFTYEYDAAGRLINENSPVVTVASVTGLGETETTSRSITKHYTYNALGQVLFIIDDFLGSDSRYTAFEYDQRGLQTQVSRGAAGQYNADTGLVESDAGSTIINQTAYNALGQAHAVTDALGNTQYNVYNQQGLLAYQVDADRYVTAYQYDGFGQEIVQRAYANTVNLLTIDNWQAGLPMSEAAMADLLVDNNDHRSLLTTYDSLGRKTLLLQNEVALFDAAYNQSYTTRPRQTFSYNGFGEIASTAVLQGIQNGTEVFATTHNYYDAMGQLIATIDPLGYNKQYRYDQLGQMILEYQASDSLSAIDGTLDAANLSSEDLASIARAGSDSRTYYLQYDALGRMTSENMLNASYSEDGNTVTGTISTEYEYDAVGNLTLETNALGAKTQHFYDNLNRQIVQIDPTREALADYLETGFVFGEVMDNISITPNTLTRYNAHGEIVELVQQANDGISDNRVTIFTRDAAGREVATQRLFKDAQDVDRLHTTLVTYNDKDQIVAQSISSNDSGFTSNTGVEFDYDGRGNQITQRSQEGELTRESKKVFNAFGELATQFIFNTDGAGNSAVQSLESYTHDAAGRLIASDEGGVPMLYAYDAAGNVTKESLYQWVDGERQALRETTRVYDLKQQLNFERRPEFTAQNYQGETTEQRPATLFTYDAFGNVVSQSDNALTTRWTYDQHDRVLSKTTADVSTYDLQSDTSIEQDLSEVFAYDAAGRQVLYTDARGFSTVNAYNAAGNLISSQVDNTSAYTRYAYNGFNEQVAKHYDYNPYSYSDDQAIFEYQNYNALGQVQSVAKRNITTGESDVLLSYIYNASGQRMINYSGSMLNTQNLASASYNGLGELKAVADSSGKRESYQYFIQDQQWVSEKTDEAGNVTRSYHGDFGRINKVEYVSGTAQSTIFKTVVTQYNDLGELTYEQTLDASGNLIGFEGRSYNDAGLLAQISKLEQSNSAAHSSSITQYAYDNRHNVIAEVQRSYDSSLSEDGAINRSMSYEYDQLDRLTLMRQEGTSFGASELFYLSYGYDENGNRVKNTSVFKDSSGNNNVVENLYHSFDSRNNIRIHNGSRVEQDGVYRVELSKAQFNSDEENRPNDLLTGKSAEVYYDNEGKKRVTQTYVGVKTDAASGALYREFKRELYIYNNRGMLTQVVVEFVAADVTSEEADSLKDLATEGRDRSKGYEAIISEQRDYYDSEADKALGLFGLVKSVTTYDNGYVTENDKLVFKAAIVGRGQSKVIYSYDAQGRAAAEQEYVWSDLVGNGEGGRDASNFGRNSNLTGLAANETYDGSFVKSRVTSNYDYDASGNTLSYDAQFYQVDENGSNAATVEKHFDVTYTMRYDWRGNYVETQTQLTGGQAQTFDKSYDAWNRLVTADVQVTGDDTDERTMLYAANGQLLERLSRDYGEADKRYYGKMSQVLADLDRYDNLVIKDSYGLQQAPSTQDSVHYVSSGDTLQSIASLYFGDSSLWYLIADANGLNGTEALEAGMRLSIPSVSSSINSTDSTFAPVDPLSEFGNTTPVAAPKQDKNAERMAACVQVMVTVVVAAIATAATGGMGSPYLAASIVAFTSTLAGDVAGQAVRKYHGLQEDIDWGSAFTSAAVAAVSAAVVPRIPGIKGIKWATAATEAVVNYSLSYVAHNAIGTDRASHWNNRDLLANIATDTAFAAIAKDTPFGNESTQRAGTKNWMQTMNDAAIGAARTVTNAALRTAIDKDTSLSYSERFNQRLDWGAVAASALGEVAGQQIGKHAAKTIGEPIRNFIDENWGGQSVGNIIASSLADKPSFNDAQQEQADRLSKQFRNAGVLSKGEAEQLANDIAASTSQSLSPEERVALAKQAAYASGASADQVEQIAQLVNLQGIAEGAYDAESNLRSSGVVYRDDNPSGGYNHIGTRYNRREGLLIDGTFGDSVASNPKALVTLTEKASPVLIPVAEGLEALSGSLNSPFVSFALTAIEVATGPVAYAVRAGVNASPVGQYINQNIAEAHDNFTSYVADNSTVLSKQGANQATAGALGILVVGLGGLAAAKSISDLVNNIKGNKLYFTGVAKNAQWVSSKQGIEGPGLRDHFGKHGADVGAKTARQFDASARITIQNGRKFTYNDRKSGRPMVGYFDEKSGLFTATSQTRKTPAILTHYPLSWREIKGLPNFSGSRNR